MIARHHLSGLVCMAALAFAWTIASPVSAAAADKVIRKLEIGSGNGDVGITPAIREDQPVGPSAMYIGQDGKLYVLDQINGRILSIDPDKPGAVPTELKLPDDLVPNDMVTVNNKLYVWDGQVHALNTPTAASDGTTALEARAVGDPDDVTRSAFAQMGSQTPSSDEEVLATAGRSLATSTFETPIKQTLVSRALGAINVDILPRKDGKSAFVEMRQQANPLSVSRADVKVDDKLGALEVLDITAKGDVFIFTENVPTSAGKHQATFVARYNQRGKLVSIYDLPISPDQLESRRFVTISPGGSVLYLHSDTSGVSIVELQGRSAKSQLIELQKTKVAANDMTIDDASPQIIMAIRPNSRLSAIQTGLAFEGFKWTVSQSNYGPDPDPGCTGFEGRTRRPWYLAGKVGQEVRGVPYCWGCFGSILQFKRNVEKGMMAGNICTKDNPRQGLAGVDCSAFVSAAWGLSRQYTTSDIPSITEPLANPWDLKPGDALNKAGSHVMLFVKFTPDRKAEVLESSTGGCNGRVCRNVYPLSVLLSRGYKPVRYMALTD
jgi:hypothetical protein